eukprot:TRINITY_DN4222_c0_g2_i1.p1 TRINITY_DN4222_c0_g2~~TRINITY_DN4222_c0_g2_i1.p1  ORF type:complete len:901 (+),score=165.03 TRINITY_DN4222_c0_g2_i1:128-2830(+)
MAPGMPEDAAARNHRIGLEGDGVNSRLFELLWKRDLLSDTSISLRIPDTIIYKYNAPSLWYFTSVDGTIKRKMKAKLNEDYIYREFLKKLSPSGIAAYYVTTATESEGDECRHGVNAESDTRTTIEYLDEEKLKEFLFNKQKVRGDGILQKFIEPNSHSNNMVRAWWSPKVCLLERRVNKQRLSDRRLDMYERAVTFEGPDFHSEVQPVRGGALVGKVHQIADCIVQHVAAVTNDRMKISRLALNFKIDHKDRLWLLFASSVRLRDELNARWDQAAVQELSSNGLSNTPLEVHTTLKVPDYIRRAQTTSHTAPATLQKTCKCPTCDDKVEAGLLFQVSYKVLIQYEEHRRRWLKSEKKRNEVDKLGATLKFQPEPPQDALTTSDNAEVPESIRKLHPRLTSAEYLQFRNEVAFHYKNATVCEACFLRFSSSPQLVKPRLHRRSAPDLNARDGTPEDFDPEADSDENVPWSKAQDPDRLRLRRQATHRRIAEMKASEEDWFDAQTQNERKEKDMASKLKVRSQSCPRLPSFWNPGPEPVAVWPPAPLLSERPRMPTEAPPASASLFNAARQETRPHTEMPRLTRKKMVPLRSKNNPYLKGLQDFTAKCTTRAGEVLGPKAAKSLAPLRRSASAATMPSASDVTVLPRSSSFRQRGRSPSPQAEDRDDIVSEDDYTSLSPLRPQSGGQTFTAPVEVDESGIISDVDLEDGGIQIDTAVEVAELWGKWPPSCGSGRGLLGKRSSTPTTRPPSQGDGFSAPSSGPSSRPSTRTSSRGPGMSAGLLARQQAAALQRLRAAREGRPSSSPQVSSFSQGRPPIAHDGLGRPSSSPSLQKTSASPARSRLGSSPLRWGRARSPAAGTPSSAVPSELGAAATPPSKQIDKATSREPPIEKDDAHSGPQL